MSQLSAFGRSNMHLFSILGRRPQAVASIVGGEDAPEIRGAVRFYQTGEGVIVWAEIGGLPRGEGPCHERVFGFHIHIHGLLSQGVDPRQVSGIGRELHQPLLHLRLSPPRIQNQIQVPPFRRT